MYRAKLRAFLADTSGAVLAYTGLVMFTLVGFTALAVDVGSWYATQRSMQAAADSAAVAGSFEAMWNGSADAVVAAAKGQAESNGFDPAFVTVNFPPASGPNIGEPGAVEVIIEQPAAGFFASLFLEGAVDIGMRSVAAQVEGVQACLVALEPTDQAILVNSDSSVTANGCMLQVNSTNSSALETNGGSTITAEDIAVAGDYSGSGISPTPQTGTPPMPDPLSYLQPPAEAGNACDFNSWTIDSDQTISEGVYCNDLVINSGTNVIMNPGVYVIRDGKFEVNSASTITGTGVTIYLMGSAELILNSGSHATLEAPTTGDLAGIVIFQDPSVPDGTVHLFNSDAASSLVGTVYFPNGKMMINSGSTFDAPAAFTSIIAKTFEINANSHLVLNSDYAGTDVPPVAALGAYQIAIFE